jgi:osmotically inducible protein OsmC
MRYTAPEYDGDHVRSDHFTNTHHRKRGDMQTRTASATWEGGLRGTGSFQGESETLGGRYTVMSRYNTETGTDPEELLAAAEAACFSMELAVALEEAGTPATRVHTEAACSLDRVGDYFRIVAMKLRVRAQVPGVDAETFRQIAEATRSGCPVSVALGGVDIELDAELE